MSDTEKITYVSGNEKWTKGAVISAEKLNNIEEKIADIQRRCTWQKIGKIDIQKTFKGFGPASQPTKTTIDTISIYDNINIAEYSNFYLEISGQQGWISGTVSYSTTTADKYDTIDYQLTVSNNNEWFIYAKKENSFSLNTNNTLSDNSVITFEDAKEIKNYLYIKPHDISSPNTFEQWYTQLTSITIERNCQFNDMDGGKSWDIFPLEDITINLKATLYALPMIKGE